MNLLEDGKLVPVSVEILCVAGRRGSGGVLVVEGCVVEGESGSGGHI